MVFKLKNLLKHLFGNEELYYNGQLFNGKKGTRVRVINFLFLVWIPLIDLNVYGESACGLLFISHIKLNW